MRALSRALLLLMALLWVPLSAHCRIAALPGLEFLQCEDHGHADESGRPAPGDAGGSCEDCGCCALEQGTSPAVRADDLGSETDFATLAVETAEFSCAPPVIRAPRGATESPPPPPPPPPHARVWSFVLRLALPVRAPSPRL